MIYAQNKLQQSSTDFRSSMFGCSSFCAKNQLEADIMNYIMEDWVIYEKPKSIKKYKKRVSNAFTPIPISLKDYRIRKKYEEEVIKCERCGWNDGPLDTHHIIYRVDGGSDDIDYLCRLCPNCHRLEHYYLNPNNIKTTSHM